MDHNDIKRIDGIAIDNYGQINFHQMATIVHEDGASFIDYTVATPRLGALPERLVPAEFSEIAFNDPQHALRLYEDILFYTQDPVSAKRIQPLTRRTYNPSVTCRFAFDMDTRTLCETPEYIVPTEARISETVTYGYAENERQRDPNGFYALLHDAALNYSNTYKHDPSKIDKANLKYPNVIQSLHMLVEKSVSRMAQENEMHCIHFDSTRFAATQHVSTLEEKRARVTMTTTARSTASVNNAALSQFLVTGTNILTADDAEAIAHITPAYNAHYNKHKKTKARNHYSFR